MKCWQCGVEPDETYEVVAMDRPGTVATFARWPEATDHEHSERPPTPDELIEAGLASLQIIQTPWAT